MRRSRFLTTSAFLSLGLLLSCADGESPTDLDLQVFAQMSVLPVFPGGATQALAGLPINVIQLTVFQVPGDVQIAQEILTVNPNDAQWEVAIEVPLSNDPGVRYVLETLLINQSNGVRSVEWSARSAPVDLAAGTPSSIQQVEVARGPPENLSVTGLVLSGPSTTPEGTDFSIAATVTSSDPAANPTVFWSSLNPDLVSISADGSASALLPGTARVQADAGTLSAIHEILITAVPTGVTMDPPGAQASAAGEQIQFAGAVVDARGDPIAGEGLDWVVGDDRILENLGDGLFRTLAGGSTTVTATSLSDPSLSNTQTVDVVIVPVSIVVEQPGPIALGQAGATAQLSIQGFGGAGTPVVGLQAAWTSSDPAIASVDASGLVTAVSTGSATITAEFDNGASSTEGSEGASAVLLTASVVVNVTLPAAAVSVVPGAVTLSVVGATQSFQASATDANGTALPNPAASWSSTNPAVATVNASTGLATAVGAGTTQIQATVDGVVGTASLTVALPTGVATIDIQPNPASFMELSSLQLTATAYDGAGQVVQGVQFTWSSSNAGIVSIDQAGVAFAEVPGSAVVTASAQGVSGQVTVTVTPGYGYGGFASYQTIGNTELVVGSATNTGTAHAYDGNDLIQQLGVQAIQPFSGTGDSGGFFDVFADGSFNYQPIPGMIGTETISVTDGTGMTHTLSVDVFGPTVWYHDPAASPGGDGTSSLPFDDLGDTTVGGPNDFVFLFGGPYTAGIQLQAGQVLLGEPAGLTDPNVGQVVPAGGSRPSIVSNNVGIDLASNVFIEQVDADGDPAIQGFTVGNVTMLHSAVTASQWHGIDLQAPFGVIDFQNIEVQQSDRNGINIDSGNATILIDLFTSGPSGIDNSSDYIVEIQNTTGGSVSFLGDDIDQTGSQGIYLANNSATIDFAQNVIVGDPTAPGLTLLNSPGDVTFTDLDVYGPGQYGLVVSGNAGLLSILDGAVQMTASPGIDVQTSDIDITLSTLTVNNTQPGHGVHFANNTGQVNLNLLQIDQSGVGTGLVFDNSGQLDITHTGSYVNVVGAQAFDVFDSHVDAVFQDVTAVNSPSQGMDLGGLTGQIVVNGGLVSGAASDGISYNGSTASVFTYNGDVTDAAGHLVTATGNNGSTLSFGGDLTSIGTGSGVFFDTNTAANMILSGRLDLQTGPNPAFVARGGGTIEADYSASTPFSSIITNTGIPVEINGTAISPNGVVFESISSDGAPYGIFLFNTGTGPFTVVGTGSPSSGGTILNSVGHGVQTDQTGAISLEWLDVHDSQSFGMWFANAPSLFLHTADVRRSAGRNLLIQNVSGATDIVNSWFQTSFGNIYAPPSVGSPTLTVDGSTFRGATGSATDANFHVSGAAVPITVDVFNSFFGASSSTVNGLRVGVTLGGSVQLNVDGGNFQNMTRDGIDLYSTGGTLEALVHNSAMFSFVGTHGVHAASNGLGGGQITVEVRDAVFDDTNIDDIRLETANQGSLDARIVDNQMTGSFSPFNGIVGAFDGSGTVRAYVHGNQIASNTNAGILFEGGQVGASSTTTVDLNVFNNNVTHTGAFEPIEFNFGENLNVCADVAGNFTTTGNTGEGIAFSQTGSAVVSLARLLGGAGSETMSAPIENHLTYENPNASGITVLVASQFDGVPSGSCTTPGRPAGTFNAPPAAHPGAHMTDGSTPLAIPLFGNDPDGDNLTFTIVTPPSMGSLGAVASTGSNSATVTYTPAGNGSDPFTIQVDDGTGTISQAVIDAINPAVMALPIAYNVQAHVQLAAGGEPAPLTPATVDGSNLFTPTPGLTAINASVLATTQGGSVALNSDGSFLYTPPLSFIGTDDFQVDAGPGGLATVTLNVMGPLVWFTDNTASPGGTGTSDDPFDIIGFAEVASGPGDILYLDAGDGSTTGHDQGINLQANQKLYGEAAGLVTPSLGTIVPPGGPRPIIDHTVLGGAVTLGGGNEVRGLELRSTGSSREGVRASGINLGSTVVENVVINSVGTGIELVSTTGLIDITNTSISGSTTAGIEVDSGSPTVTFGTGSSLITTAGQGIYVRNTTGGTQTFSGASLNFGGAEGVTAFNANSTVVVDNATVSPGTGTGIQIDNSGGSFTFNNLDIAGTSMSAIGVDGGSPIVNVALLGGGGVSITSGDLLSVTNLTGGAVSIGGSGTMTDAGADAIWIENNAAPVTVTVPTSVNTTASSAANSGLYMALNPGAVTFSDLTITTTDIPGIEAVSGNGLLTISTGSVNTTNDLAIKVDQNPVALNLTSATSTNSLSRGIWFENSSGTATIGGGSITNPSTEAFFLFANTGLVFNYAGSASSSTDEVVDAQFNTTASSFTFTGTLDYNGGGTGIDLQSNTGSVFNFTNNLTLNAYGIAFNASGGGSVNITGGANAFSSGTSDIMALHDLEGTNTIQNSTADFSPLRGIDIFQTTGSASFTLTSNSTSNASAEGIAAVTSGTGDLTVLVTNSTSSNNTTGVQGAQLAASSGSLSLTVDATSGSNVLNGNTNGVGVATVPGTTGTTTFLIDSNTINSSGFHAVQLTTGGSTGFTGTISNNTMDLAGNTAIQVSSQVNGLATVTIDSNTITNPSVYGIRAATSQGTGDFSDLSLHITNNAVDVPYYLDGIRLESSESGVLCADVSGNSFTDLGGGFSGIAARQEASTATFQLERMIGSQTNSNVVAAALLADNPSDDGMGHFAFISTQIDGVVAGTCR